MRKALGIMVLLVLAGCATAPGYQPVASPCAVSEASYACQVERYHNVNVQ
jgi:hypothetical protein